MKAVQYFSDEYLEQCKKMTPEQIVRFLDDFRQLQGVQPESRSKLISLKVPEDLLRAFRARCDMEGVKYQTQIKKLMSSWLGVSE
jgi:predicted DNA binding CopG/RHH family protein